MSIKIMTRVWERSKQGSSQLLLLLAIADNANDGGFAWPGQEYLAKKIRMDKRSIPRLAKKLQESHELFIVNRSVDGKSNQYIVMVGISWEEFSGSLKKYLGYDAVQIAFAKRGFDKLRGVDNLSPPTNGGVDIAVSGGVDIAVSGGVDIAVSTEPSLPVNESSFLEKNPKLDKQTFTRQQKDELTLIGHHPNVSIVEAIRENEVGEKQGLNALATQLATICQIDIDTTASKTREALKQLTVSLYGKPDIVKHLANFPHWWRTNDWRGKQGQVPTPGQIGDTWGQFAATTSTQPGSTNGPILTPEQKARLDELTAQDTQK